MSIFWKGFGCLIGLFFSLQASAGEADAQALLAALNPIQNLEANFVQTIQDGHGRVIQKSEGKLFLKRPGLFRWKIDRPIPQLIVANKTRLWIYDPDLEQVVIRPVAKELGKTPAFLLSHVDTAITRDFIVERMPAKAQWEWFSLTPKTKDNLFRVIQLGFLNHGIREMRMQDNLGHDTRIQFKQVKENGTLSETLFQFHPPANVDVIDETHGR